MPPKVHTFLWVLDLLGKCHKSTAYGWITQVNITCCLRRYGRHFAVGCGLHKWTWRIQSVSCVHRASLTWLVRGKLQTWARVFKTFWCGPKGGFYVLNRKKKRMRPGRNHCSWAGVQVVEIPLVQSNYQWFTVKPGGCCKWGPARVWLGSVWLNAFINDLDESNGSNRVKFVDDIEMEGFLSTSVNKIRI